MNISVSHKDLTYVKIIIDGRELFQVENQNHVTQKIYPEPAQQLTIEFQPFGIKPLIRVDGFLLDYWLAGIKQQDHRIDLKIDSDFVDRYRCQDRRGRIDSLGEQQKNIEHYLDKYIGIDNLYPDLVSDIRAIINEKSNIRHSAQD